MSPHPEASIVRRVVGSLGVTGSLLVACTVNPPAPGTAPGATDAAVADAAVADAAVADARTDVPVAVHDAAGTPDARAPSMGPGTGASWHIDLEVPVDTTVAADWYDIDLFDNPATTVQAIHAHGHRVICYFSAGSGETWRPDYGTIPAVALGSPLAGWPGERWLDVRTPAVHTVMAARMDRAVGLGCDGVDPDNVDGYANANGLGLTADDQLAYNRWLATSAHARGLWVGLKNDLDQVPALAAVFDFAVNESCFEYSECAALTAFVHLGRGVLNIEYGDPAVLRPAVCPQAATLGFYSILAPANRLDGTYTRCR